MGSFEVDNTLGLYNYLGAVESISDSYFDEQYDYQPQFGRIKVIYLYYTLCVKQSDIKINTDTDGASLDDIVKLTENDEFMSLFNNAIKCGDDFSFDFAHAYKDAMDIVDSKKHVINYDTKKIEYITNSIIDNLHNTFSDIDIDKLGEIAKEVSDGTFNFETLVNAYGNSDRFKDVTSGKVVEKDESISDT